MHVWPVGAAVQRLLVPDRAGRLADVVLGYDDMVAYQDQARAHPGDGIIQSLRGSLRSCGAGAACTFARVTQGVHVLPPN